MASDISLAFIGCGNMGGAILEGMLAAGTLPPDEILVIERSQDIRTRCAALGVQVDEHVATARSAPRILLAVKPQGFPDVAEALAPLPESALVMSIMAGLSSRTIRSAVGGHARIVRSMPNTPCKVHQGISAVSFGEGAEEPDVAYAEEMLGTVGEVVRVEEADMFAVTATSGSGPAYAFILAEAWIDGAIEQGLDRDIAERLVKATMRGASMLVDEDADHAMLRAAVTSKGGTTAAAIAVLEERGFPEAMRAAIAAATERGRELDSEVPS